MISIVLIFLTFAVIHSMTVTQKFKDACRNIFGDTFMRVFYRALYNTVSFITAFIAFFLIHRLPDQELWAAPLWLRWIMYGIQIAGLTFGSLAFEYLDTWEFMGFKQIWRYASRHEVGGNIEGQTQKELVTGGVYGIVRHPLYFAGLVIFTFNPHVTFNTLTVTVLADLYFLFGMFIEERRFLEIFGDQYREYMKRVPRFIPRWKRRV
ncbi:MAG TPA: isoprenylcysteine carboxylmethyltransferase family protein [Nitrospirota bacterium]|nr:isoprenylcysteine carboxylmethyltransferase family protein [Nitrospirota bacterium]